MPSDSQPRFLHDWASMHFARWDAINRSHRPSSVLEIGAFEGRASLFWSAKDNVQTVTCVDTWAGSSEHGDMDFTEIERNFDLNTRDDRKIIKQKMLSSDFLAMAMVQGRQYDLIYVDGSHAADDVLADAVMSWHCCSAGGLMIFDDYLWINRYRFGPWSGPRPSSMTSHPKTAIDCFTNIYEQKLRILDCGYQMVLEKLHD